MEKDLRLLNNLCPYCGEKLDSATDTLGEGARPKEGDISICLYCTNISKFNEEIGLEKPTEEDMKEYQSDKETWSMVLSAQKLIKDLDLKNKKR